VGGHLVNTASFAGLFTYSYDRLPYAATKAALVHISECLAIQSQPKVIGVTLLCPGPVLTNIAAAVPKSGDPVAVGELIADAILRNRFFVPPIRMSWTSCAAASLTGTPISTTRSPANPTERHTEWLIEATKGWTCSGACCPA
jgi:NAD(P)-dependent dehydrogenase (short-subunit alcohol dehydrogenase family)